MSSLIRRVKNSWLPDLPDFRDHAFMTARPVVLPQSVDLRPSMPPVYDQGDLGSCTAQAIAAAFDFARGLQTKKFMHPSRLFVYYNERVMEGSVQEDSGAMIRDGIKSVAALGVCEERLWPYHIPDFKRKPSAAAYKGGRHDQSILYRRVAADVRSMLTCLAQGYPFVFGFSVYDSFLTDTVAQTGLVPMPGLLEAQSGGHAVLAVGYDQKRRQFLVRNSWSDAWGLGGYCWMPFEYLSDPDLSDDRWQISLVEN